MTSEAASPPPRQPERAFHHRHAAAADMRGDDRAVCLQTRVSSRLGRPMSTPCPIRSFNSPSRSPARSASSAAAATVALPVAGSSDRPLDRRMEHPRLQVAGFGGRHIARIEIDRIAAVAWKRLGECGGVRLSPAAARRARPASTTRNGSPTETICGGCRSTSTSVDGSDRQAAACSALTGVSLLQRLRRGEFGARRALPSSVRISTGTRPGASSNSSRAGGFGGLRRQHEGGADIGMARERDLRFTREDANLRVVRGIARRQHEGRLGIIELGARSPASARSTARRHRAPPPADCRRRRGR